MRNILLVLTFCFTGCSLNPPKVCEREYREIPEGYLQACVLPEVPQLTGELSEAFVTAYNCAQLGNADKQRIRELITK